jgi:hypothetical protein
MKFKMEQSPETIASQHLARLSAEEVGARFKVIQYGQGGMNVHRVLCFFPHPRRMRGIRYLYKLIEKHLRQLEDLCLKAAVVSYLPDDLITLFFHYPSPMNPHISPS